MALVLSALLLFCVLIPINVVISTDPPHIIIILADDMGWNDVSFHGSDQIPTPNLDALAYNGVILNSHYVQSVCTPSRAALLSGKYPIKLGMQGQPLKPAEPSVLPDVKLMPEYFKELGYATHLVGKWHLGYASWNDTPTHKGFDHHFGYLNGLVSYYDYLITSDVNGKPYTGFDLWRDHTPAWDVQGQYATDVFTQEATIVIQNHNSSKPLFMVLSHLALHTGNKGKYLEAPQETINKFKYVTDSSRRTYAAMMSKLDDSVGTVVEALSHKDMLQNSILLFMSDNGAPTDGQYPNWGSNYPMRSVKNTLFEGGVRSASFVWSPLINKKSRVSNELIHMTDWLATLYSAGGGNSGQLDPDLDSINQWPSLVNDLPSPRSEILLNIDERVGNAGLRLNNWKLIVGPPAEPFQGYLGESGKDVQIEVVYNTSAVANSLAGRTVANIHPPVPEDEYIVRRKQATLACSQDESKRKLCNPQNGQVCLYDIPSDPCEEYNLAPYFPNVVQQMKRILMEHRSKLVPQVNQLQDIKNGDPKLFQYIWHPWLGCTDINSCNV